MINSPERNGHFSANQAMPPHDPDAERAVIGAALISGKAAEYIAGELTAKDFYSETHRVLFGGIVALVDRGQTVDQITLRDELVRQDTLERIGGRAYIFELYESVPTAANTRKHADLLQEHTRQRGILDWANRIENEILSRRPENALNAVENLSAYATETEKGKDIVTFADGEDEYRDMILRRSQGELPIGITTGVPGVDRVSTGHHPQTLTIIAARPAMGKSAFTLQGAVQSARAGEKILYFSYEMPMEQQRNRAVCMVAGVSFDRFRTEKITPQEASRLLEAYDQLKDLSIFFQGPGIGTSTSDISRMAKAMKPDIVYVDHLQLVDSRRAEVKDLRGTATAVSKELKQLANRMSIPVVVVSQLTRECEKRPDKRPMLSDLRESGSIEQDADRVIMLYRDEYYYPDGRIYKGPDDADGKPIPGFQKGKIEFLCRKDRDGSVWGKYAYFSGEAMFMTDTPLGDPNE